MPKESLPVKLDPFRFAENAIRVHGVLPINQLARLCTSLYATDGDIDVSLDFGIDEEKIRYLHGHIETTLMLQCQRCMGSFVFEVNGDFTSGIVNTEEEAEKLPPRYDPVMAKEGMLIVPDMIEDELIIGLPLVPMHDPKDCQVKLPLKAVSDSEMEKDNPFKVIELLRSKRDSK
jgi:uncharacterized protein